MRTDRIALVIFAAVFLLSSNYEYYNRKKLESRVDKLEVTPERDTSVSADGCPATMRGMEFTHSAYQENYRGIDTGVLSCFYKRARKTKL